MELKDTIEGMTSTDYKERFKAEYKQLTIRIEKLNVIINKAKDETLEFNLSCPLCILETQALYMNSYAEILRIRARKESIDLC